MLEGLLSSDLSSRPIACIIISTQEKNYIDPGSSPQQADYQYRPGARRPYLHRRIKSENKQLETSWVEHPAAKRHITDELVSSAQIDPDWMERFDNMLYAFIN